MQLTSSSAASADTGPRLANTLGSEIVQRVGSAVILAILAIADIVAGGWYFSALVILIGALLAYEWVGLMRLDSLRHRNVMFALVSVAIVALVVGATLSSVRATIVVIVVAMLPGLALLVHRKRRFLNGALGGVLYIGIPALSLIWLRHEQGSEALLVLWLFVIVWATDTGAYMVGSAIGGPKLLPSISPNKTWSGAVGGIAVAGLIGLTLSIAMGGSALAGAVTAMSLAVLAHCGDLFESMLKRRARVKHSGHLIPGHGGMLDRLDGLMFAAPALALVMLLLDPSLVG